VAEDAETLSPLTVVDAAGQLTFAIHEILTRVASEHDLSVTQLRVLGILRDREPSMAALAAHLGLDRSSVTGLIDRAERRGHVARGKSTADARVVTVTLTDAGRALGSVLEDSVNTAVTAVLANAAPDDVSALVRITRSLQR
jgi:DNA-binding MarR family transcriptional regulator